MSERANVNAVIHPAGMVANAGWLEATGGNFAFYHDGISIGTCASVVSNLMVHRKTKSTLDDTLDVFPCHGVGGMVGMLMTGVFARDVGLITGSPRTFIVHCLALVFVAAFSFAGSYLLYKVTDLIIPLRVSDEQEEIGLDVSQHGEVMQDIAAAMAPRPVLAKIA